MKPSASSTVDLKVNFSRHTTATSPHSPQLTAAVVDTRRCRILRSLMIRVRMFTSLLPGDIEKAFLQIGVKEEDRDAFRFLFNIKGTEKHLRFTLVPFGVEASPFLLGATL